MDQKNKKDYPPVSDSQSKWKTLRKVILTETGQDINRCRGCGSCNAKLPNSEMDISLDSLIQMVLQDDEEVLSSRTLWSDNIFTAIQYACQRGLDLRSVLTALRAEATLRDIMKGTER